MAETARALKITRKTLYNWAEADPELKAGMEQLKEDRIDFTESQMMKLIKGYSYNEIHEEYDISIDENGNEVRELKKRKKVLKKVSPSQALIQFHLKTKGGYTEKKEIDVTTNGQSLNMAPSVLFINPHEDEQESSDPEGEAN